MGGKGSGGRRTGSGRKKKAARLKLAHGTATAADRLAAFETRAAREAAGQVPAAGGDLRARLAGGRVAPPAGMTDRELEVWEELAPKAIAKGTLTETEARSFALLCRAIVLERRYLETIDEDGLTIFTQQGTKAHPLIGPHRGILQRVEAAMIRFMLSPIGKELEEAKPAKPMSKLALLRGAL